MSDEATTGQEPTTTTEEITPPEATPTDVPATSPAADTVETLPDWAQKMVKELRSENAKHRKAKTEAEKAAEAAAKKQAEEQGEYKRLYEEAEARRLEAEQKAQLAEQARLRDQVALKHKLPPALADRLRGETEEELEADAKALLEAMPQPQVTTATDAANGSNNNQSTPAMDDRAIQEMAAVYGVSVENIKTTLGIK